ncbi:MAG: LysM domain-containing protein [Bacteroidota bacterium]
MFGAAIAEAQSIHLLLVADTTDPNLVSASQTNIQRIEKKFAELASSINHQLNIHKVVKNRLAYRDIDALIKRVDSAKEDIIFFHYSGHGVNSQTDRWPKFLINDPQNQAKLSLIKSRLEQRDHRLLICMADCCNLAYFPRGASKRSQWNTEELTGKGEQQSLEKLFLQHSGSIICSGSQPGRPSHYESALGGYFTTSFFLALFETQKGLHPPQWEKILERTAGLTLQMTSDINLNQRPQYEIEDYAKSFQEAPKIETYQVRKGDTLYGIAKRHRVTLRNLRQWNDMAPTENQIQVGQVLSIGQKN